MRTIALGILVIIAVVVFAIVFDIAWDVIIKALGIPICLGITYLMVRALTSKTKDD